QPMASALTIDDEQSTRGTCEGENGMPEVFRFVRVGAAPQNLAFSQVPEKELTAEALPVRSPGERSGEKAAVVLEKVQREDFESVSLKLCQQFAGGPVEKLDARIEIARGANGTALREGDRGQGRFPSRQHEALPRVPEIMPGEVAHILLADSG